MQLVLQIFILTCGAHGELVTLENFPRAETEMYLKKYADGGAFGKWLHYRRVTPIDKQDVIRMNRDTLYSALVLDLSSPATLLMPGCGDRFQSLVRETQDANSLPTLYPPGNYTFTMKDNMGARYMFLIVRTFAPDENNASDVTAVHECQDAMEIQQSNMGSFELTDWDKESHSRVRNALNELRASSSTSLAYGKLDEIMQHGCSLSDNCAAGDRLSFLMAQSSAWGGQPPQDATYLFVTPKGNDGTTPHSLTAKDVPILGDGFFSVTVYNKSGYLSGPGPYNFNDKTARENADGSVTFNFGNCSDPKRLNCMHIEQGWNYIVRLYRPSEAVWKDRTYSFPEAKPDDYVGSSSQGRGEEGQTAAEQLSI